MPNEQGLRPRVGLPPSLEDGTLACAGAAGSASAAREDGPADDDDE